MGFLEGGQVNEIFQKLEQFLRKVGNLEIFDTLVYNYRLRPKLDGKILEEFSRIFNEFLQTLKSVQIQIQSPAAGLKLTGAQLNKKTVKQSKKPCTKKQRPKSSEQSQNHQNPNALILQLQCDLCPPANDLKFFTNIKQLNAHKISFHKSEIQLFPCNLCSESFRYNSSLAKHKQRKHRNQEDVYSCTFTGCTSVFPKRISLTNHKLKVHGIEPERRFPCSHCSNWYSTPNSLKTHISSHHKDKTISAPSPTAPATSSDNTQGKAHSQAQDPLKCTVCSKEFSRKDKLVLHARTHSGYKPFTCETCGKSFNRKSKLLYHRERLHDELEPGGTRHNKFQCQIQGCEKSYALNTDLKIHIRNKHFPNEKGQGGPPQRRQRLKNSNKSKSGCSGSVIIDSSSNREENEANLLEVRVPKAQIDKLPSISNIAASHPSYYEEFKDQSMSNGPIGTECSMDKESLELSDQQEEQLEPYYSNNSYNDTNNYNYGWNVETSASHNISLSFESNPINNAQLPSSSNWNMDPNRTFGGRGREDELVLPGSSTTMTMNTPNQQPYYYPGVGNYNDSERSCYIESHHSQTISNSYVQFQSLQNQHPIPVLPSSLPNQINLQNGPNFNDHLLDPNNTSSTASYYNYNHYHNYQT